MKTKKKKKPDIFQETCLSRQVLGLIADQWTPLVIYALEEGTMRFSHLLKRINGISKKMLTQTLRGLERNGLVKRVIYPVIPPMVEYSLTPLGQTLTEPILALRDRAGYSLRRWLIGSSLHCGLNLASLQKAQSRQQDYCHAQHEDKSSCHRFLLTACAKKVPTT